MMKPSRQTSNLCQDPRPTRKKPIIAMPVRASTLSRNQRAGNGEPMPRPTVHHNPAKYMAPSARPAASAGSSADSSVIAGTRRGLYFLVFPGGPVPRIPAAQTQATEQQRQGPGVPRRVMLVQPRSQQRPEQRRHGDRPADHAHHAETGPDDSAVVALRPQLARNLSADLLPETIHDAERPDG